MINPQQELVIVLLSNISCSLIGGFVVAFHSGKKITVQRALRLYVLCMSFGMIVGLTMYAFIPDRPALAIIGSTVAGMVAGHFKESAWHD